MRRNRWLSLTGVLLALVLPLREARGQQPQPPGWLSGSSAGLERELGRSLSGTDLERLCRGLGQVSRFWRAEDGDSTAFEEFVRGNFAADQAALDVMFQRFEQNFEALDGHLHEISRVFGNQADLDLGPILGFDEAFSGYDVSAHLADDLFANKLAFTVLLNFPLTTLAERLEKGADWSRRQWAEARLAGRFTTRVPASVQLEQARAGAEASSYIASYNIWMHHLLGEGGRRLFPPGQRLLSHWNLREEIRAGYLDPNDGIVRQRMIQRVMEHIVEQTIPAAVVDNPHVDWDPMSGRVTPAAVKDAGDFPDRHPDSLEAREPDTRYATLLSTFQAARLLDPYAPTAPTHIARSFDEGRELPEARVRAMLEAMLSSPLVPRVAELAAKRLGRPLEPFDLWYNGFKPSGTQSGAELERQVRRRYPTAQAFERDILRILRGLGFSKERAEYLGRNIVVDPARGSGHAMGPGMRSAPAHLRTRVEKGGMDYKGYNIAVHELGHNVEQVFSLHLIDYTSLSGVPNTAFTEALAFVFQNRDLELLGLTRPDPTTEALRTLDEFWITWEIAGVALVDMGVWHWLYQHPAATPAEVKEATLGIAREVWNRYYAPVLGRRDVVLLGVYSHMIDSWLYLPDYPVGHMIAFQIQEQMARAGKIGAEFERMSRIGRLTPDLWMRQATGAPVGPEALLAATERALTTVGRRAM